MKVLIAEDNENSRVLLESLLTASDFEVRSAGNGKIALELAKADPPDLIISDILMPEMDGYALCRRVKATETLKHIPFIFYTATYTDPNDERLAMEVGASRFILKPMEVDRFLEEVKSVLDEHGKHQIKSGEPLCDDADLNSKYAEVLARKLDEKVQALEEEKRITEKAQKALQQAQKMEAIGTLAGGIAHDFNNLLTPIIGYTELTRMTLEEGSRERNNLQEVLNAAHRAKELARQILTFCRQTEEKQQPLLLQAILKEVLKLIRVTIPATIEIDDEIDTRCSAISANPTQINQVVMNLCTNAYYAMRDTGGVLSVSLRETELKEPLSGSGANFVPGRYAMLEISDTGGGIEKKDLEKIFEPYFTTKPKDEGTGLGLSVVHGIVRGHDGYINVESDVGRGTTFQVCFPVVLLGANEVKPQADSLAGGTETILLVDDNESIRCLFEQQLKKLGYSVYQAQDAPEALELYRANAESIDLVITDMAMPKMSGAELAEKLLSVNGSLSVILCTGYSEQIDSDRALALGIKDFLHKPVSMYDLSISIRKVLDAEKTEPRSV